MIDTHCHLTYDGLFERLGEVLEGAEVAGVDRMVTVGTTPADASNAIRLAEDDSRIFATAGIHPHYAPPDEATLVAMMDALRNLASAGGIVALGEMGLDRHYPEPPIDQQRRAFEAQLTLAIDFPGLPLIVHNREATNDTLAVLRDSGLPGDRFVFHCFTGTAEELDRILDFGAFVGFTGIVTFNSARDLAAASDRVPLERLFVETDSPYLTPEPHRKVRPNEPKYVADVARFLAARRGMSPADFAAATDANAERFYRLPPRG